MHWLPRVQRRRCGPGRRFGPASILALSLFGLAVPMAYGEMVMRQLPNGIRLIVKPNRSNRILAIQCFFNVGTFTERPEQDGLTNLVCHSMLKGTKKRSALQIAETMEAIGGAVDASASEDYVTVSTISTVDDLGVALDVLSDVILHPTFPPDEVDKERQAILAAIRQEEDNSFRYTYKNFRRLLYEGHSYALPVLGTAETLPSITYAHIEDYHREYFTASNMLAVVVGDVDPDRMTHELARAFAELPSGQGAFVTVAKAFRSRPRSETLTKEIAQAFIVLGYVTDRARSEDYAALKVADAVLGAGMSSRLFVRLRDRRGLAYAVGSAMPTLRDKSHFFAYIGTKPESTAEARDGLLEVVRGLATEPLPDEELDRAKKQIIGHFRIQHQRNSNQAFYLGLYETVGLGATYDETYPDLIKAVTADDVRAVAKKYFRAPTVTILKPPGAISSPAGAPQP